MIIIKLRSHFNSIRVFISVKNLITYWRILISTVYELLEHSFVGLTSFELNSHILSLIKPIVLVMQIIGILIFVYIFD